MESTPQQDYLPIDSIVKVDGKEAKYRVTDINHDKEKPEYTLIGKENGKLLQLTNVKFENIVEVIKWAEHKKTAEQKEKDLLDNMDLDFETEPTEDEIMDAEDELDDTDDGEANKINLDF